MHAGAAVAAVAPLRRVDAGDPADRRPPAGSTGPYDVAIERLRGALSARQVSIDADHVRALLQISPLPPIVVHRPTMKVIDGLHRVEVAKRRGQATISAYLVDCTEELAFVGAVKANVAHGKPLTIVERERAARRILAENSAWSDRRVAEVCGISPATVARVRSNLPTGNDPRSRVGRDGRRRPVDAAATRLRVAQLLSDRPDASIRSIAALAGTSQATVRDVRDRLSRDDSPLPPRLRDEGDSSDEEIRADHQHDSGTQLRVDRAFASTSDGTTFANWFDEHAVADTDWEPFIDVVPLGRVYEVIEETRRRARSWDHLAEALHRRLASTASR